MEKGIFDDFITATLKVFSFLESEYGFERSEPFIYAPECSIEYVRSGILIAITHETGGSIWVWVAEEGENGMSAFHDLSKLIKRVSPQRIDRINPDYTFGKRSKREIEENLRAYADFLCHEGRCLLEGDFAIIKPEDYIGEAGS